MIMTVVRRILVAGLVARFLTGNLGLGFALMVRSVLLPRLLWFSVSPRCARIRANTHALALGGNVQDRACLRGFDDFDAALVTEFIRIAPPVHMANGPQRPYIRHATLNGAEFNKTFLDHPQIAGGGELIFEMTSDPLTKWASVPESRAKSALEKVVRKPD